MNHTAFTSFTFTSEEMKNTKGIAWRDGQQHYYRHSFLEKARPCRFQKSGTDESLRNILIGKYRFILRFLAE